MAYLSIAMHSFLLLVHFLQCGGAWGLINETTWNKVADVLRIHLHVSVDT